MNFLLDLWESTKPRLAAIITGLLDAGLMIIWMLLQWVTNWVLIQLMLVEVTGEFILLAFKIIFAIGTLLPIILYIYQDLRVMWIRVHQYIHRIRDESLAERKTRLSANNKKQSQISELNEPEIGSELMDR